MNEIFEDDYIDFTAKGPKQKSAYNLGIIIKDYLKGNPDGLEVKKIVLEELGIPLKSLAYADWLIKHKLKMLKPTRKHVCFINLK